LFSYGIGSLAVTSQWATQQSCSNFYADASSTIYGSFPVQTTITGTPTLRYSMTLEKLQ
jgi:hypothetical protein